MLGRSQGDRGRACPCAVAVILWAVIGHLALAALTERAATVEQRHDGGDEPIVTDLDLYATLEGERA